MKKLMCLGGSYFQTTVVKAAKRLGCYVIDVDYLPGNPAHKYADEYHNISTLDKEVVLDLAAQKGIDGIISYASDISAPTAAFVAEKLGLPSNPYETVVRMTRKDLFREYLKKHGFFVPESARIRSFAEAVDFFERTGKAVILKPARSSGSKGVCKAENLIRLQEAYRNAKQYSAGDELVVEEFMNRDGYQIAGDAFLENGKIVYFGIGEEHFDRLGNLLVPVGESFPSVLEKEKKEQAENEIQRAVNLLGLKHGAVNLDVMFDKEGHIFIIELGPRNGGNLIADAIRLGGGPDLAEYTVRAALGENPGIPENSHTTRYVSSYIYHSNSDGIFDGVEFTELFKSRVRRSDLFVQKGDRVYRYDHGGFGLGAALLEYETQEEMLYMMDHMEEFCRIRVKADL